MTVAGRRFLVLLVVIAVIGTVGFALAGGLRGALSFLAGLGIATLVVVVGTMLVDIASRMSPALAMIAALSNYLLTVLVFILLLRSVDRSVADVPAFALGLVGAIAPYLAWQLTRARPSG